MTLTSPGLIRINSAIKCGNKVKNIHSNSLQKLYLGKVTKPNFIIPH